MKIIFTILLILICFSSYSQTKNQVISALQNADSIILISHIITDEYAVIKPGEKTDHNYPLLIKGNINPEIILKKGLINKTESFSLLQILNRNVNTKRWAPANCDQPHNSILIYKNAKLSYIDICFDCYRIHSSKNLQFIQFDMDPKKWKDLLAFFKKLHVNYAKPD